MESKLGAAEFKATCLAVLEEVAASRRPVTITKRGKPVAVLTPIKEAARRRSIIGAMRGSVLRFDDPFSPAIDPSEWNAVRGAD